MTPDIHTLHAHRESLADVIDALDLELAEAPAMAYATTSGHRSKRARRDEEALAVAEAMGATKALVVWFGRDREGLLGLWRGPDRVALDRAPVVRLDGRGDFDIVALRLGDYFVVSVDDALLEETCSALDAAGLAHARDPDEVWASIEGLPSPNTHRDAALEESRLRRGLDP